MNGLRVVFLTCWLVGTLEATVMAQDVQFSGRTREYANGAYQPVADIKIVVYRSGPVTNDKSDADGKFDFKIPAGTPFRVLFVGPDDYLPELQSLSGEPQTNQNVHVCLLTIAEAKRQNIQPYQHLKAIIDQLEAQGIPRNDLLLKLLWTRLAKLG